MIYRKKQRTEGLVIVLLTVIILSFLSPKSFPQGSDEKKSSSPAEVSNSNVIKKSGEIIVNAERERRSYVYNPEGKRDPFKPPYLGKKKKVAITEEGTVLVEGLQQYLIKSLSLTGIITKGDKSIAMIKAPDGRIYIVKDKSKIGPSGIVKKINPSEVIIEDEITIKEEDESGNIIARKEKKEVIMRLKSS